MAYLDGFTANLFHTDQAGTRFFIVGKTAYAMRPESESRIRATMKAYYAVMIASIILGQIFLGWKWSFFLIIPVSMVVVSLLKRFLVKDLEPINISSIRFAPVTRLDTVDASARAMGKMTLWLLVLCSGVLTSASAWILIAGNRPLLGWSGTAFFGTGTALFVFQLWRLRNLQS